MSQAEQAARTPSRGAWLQHKARGRPGQAAAAAVTRKALLLLALVAVQGLGGFVRLAHGMAEQGQPAGGHHDMKPGGATGSPDRMEELFKVVGDAPFGRELLQSIKDGPLPGLIPGFPKRGGLGPGDRSWFGRIGDAAEEAFINYVVNGEDPIAIALRQLSIVVIEQYGAEVQNAIGRAVRDIEAELDRYSAFLGRVVDGLEDSNLDNLVFSLQQEIRALVIVQACLEDIADRMKVYVAFLTASTSSWVAWYYGIQFRFRVLLIALLSQNDPFGLEYIRVLYSLADVTKLVGLILKPWINLAKFELKFLNTLNDIIFAEYQRERNRLTITPSIEVPGAVGSGENLQAVIDRIMQFTGAVNAGGGNMGEILKAATTGRDLVIAALRPPNANGSSNVGGLFKNAERPLLGRMAGMAGGAGIFSSMRG